MGDELKGAVVELTPYVYDSFGNKSRIDYGTGHETNFFAFLFCLAKLGLITDGDRVAVVTRVVTSYLDLMRKLQMTYGLEPAGSAGVWGLDDYQFLPFVLGAAQLINHPVLPPSSILQEDVVRCHESHYMFFGCVSFVQKVSDRYRWSVFPESVCGEDEEGAIGRDVTLPVRYLQGPDMDKSEYRGAVWRDKRGRVV